MAQSLLFSELQTYAPGRALLLPGTRKRGTRLGVDMVGADLRYGGIYKLSGTTKVAGSPDVPVSRRVRLYAQRGAAYLVKEAWSHPDGNYEFGSVAFGPWMVISRDHTGEYNAVIADNIYGEPM